jgi:predicted esterase
MLPLTANTACFEDCNFRARLPRAGPVYHAAMGQLPTIRALSALAFLLARPLLAAEAPAAFPRGEVVPKVPCAGIPDQSYALYLPSNYSPDRHWPILYVLDPRGRGASAAEFFRAGAERFGYILASSNNTASDTAMTPNFDAMRAVWNDTHARFPLDDRRVYAAGFSGTVRAACTLATTAPGSISGIIGAGAGFPFDRPPTKDTPFAFFGTIGREDFNYYEVLDLEEKLQALALPHRIDVFDGTHQWPPPELAARALGWMTLHAMRTGAGEKDPALIEALWNEDLARARAFETAGDLFQAFRTWTALATSFSGLRDTAEADRKVAELKASEALRRDLAAREERNRRDKEYLEQAPGILAMVNPSGQAVAVGQVVNALKIPELKKKERSDDLEERLSAKRLLNTLAGQTAFYLPQQFAERKQWDRALFVLSIAAEIRPEDPGVWYSQAVVHARKGDRRKALAGLRRAVETGWKDAERVETHEAFAPFREDGEFRKIVAEIKAKAR